MNDSAMGLASRLLPLMISFLMAAIPTTDCFALSRTETLDNLLPYLNLQYHVTADNVYPNGCRCYRPAPTLREKLPVGDYRGMVYSYGNKHRPADFLQYLNDGRGAGNSRDLFFFYGDTSARAKALQDSVHRYVTGIDCSGLVARALEYSTEDVALINAKKLKTSSTISLPVITPADLRPGDILASTGHVVMLVQWESIPTRATIVEASGTKRMCVERIADIPTDFPNYEPRVPIKLKDDPAADVLSFDALIEGPAVRLAWTTLLEDQTAAFVILRSSSPQGPFLPISEEIPARGSATAGANYEFTDTEFPGSPTYYQLSEIETNGRELIHGLASAEAAPPPRPRDNPPASK